MINADTNPQQDLFEDTPKQAVEADSIASQQPNPPPESLEASSPKCVRSENELLKDIKNDADLIEDNKLTLLALSNIQNVGFYTVRNLFNKLNGDLWKVWQIHAEELFEILREMRTPQPAQVVGHIKNEQNRLLLSAKDQFRFLQSRLNTKILFRHTLEYPKQLERLKDAPAWLFVQGNANLLRDEKIVAVVGTRVPSEGGIETARTVSGELIKERCIILSGLAEGIDEAGHQTAVDYGSPTIAVLGHGLDVTFPAKTAGLRKEIVERGGAIVSEYMMRDSYSKEKFIQRNRIQAALSGAVAVIEAKSKSGTAHTVKFARGSNVPLFGAVKGDIHAVSTHEMLRDLHEAGDPVFDIGTSIGKVSLRYFVQHVFKDVDESSRKFDYRLFNGVSRDVARITREYNPSDEDFDWLISEIHNLRKNKS